MCLRSPFVILRSSFYNILPLQRYWGAGGLARFLAVPSEQRCSRCAPGTCYTMPCPGLGGHDIKRYPFKDGALAEVSDEWSVVKRGRSIRTLPIFVPEEETLSEFLT